jgi:hypothetical protein
MHVRANCIRSSSQIPVPGSLIGSVAVARGLDRRAPCNHQVLLVAGRVGIVSATLGPVSTISGRSDGSRPGAYRDSATYGRATVNAATVNAAMMDANAPNANAANASAPTTAIGEGVGRNHRHATEADDSRCHERDNFSM